MIEIEVIRVDRIKTNKEKRSSLKFFLTSTYPDTSFPTYNPTFHISILINTPILRKDLGGDYMIPVGQDEILSRFSGIRAVS